MDNNDPYYNQKIDKLYDNIIKTLKDRQSQHNTQNRTDKQQSHKGNKIKSFLDKLEEPHSFRLLKEIGNAFNNNNSFYMKPFRTKYRFSDSELYDLLGMPSSSDSELKQYIDTNKVYDVYTPYPVTIIALRDEKSNVAISPTAIFGIKAEYDKLKHVILRETDMFDFGLRHSFGFTRFGLNQYFSFGEVHIFGSDTSSDNIIKSVSRSDYPWKKKTVRIKSSLYKSLVKKRFKGKDQIIDHIDVLYKGDDRGVQLS